MVAKTHLVPGWLWSTYSHTYDGLLSFWPYTHLLSLMVAAANVQPGERILDAGCGTGNLLSQITQDANVAAVGVDVSKGMLGVARRKLERSIKTGNTVLVESDLLSFASAQADGSFDCILSVNVLYAIAEQSELWSEFVRILKPGGRVVATTSVITGSGPIIREHFANSSFLKLFRPRLIGVFFIDALINALGNRDVFPFSDEADLRKAVSEAGGAWLSTQKCYGGSEKGVNILFNVSKP